MSYHILGLSVLIFKLTVVSGMPLSERLNSFYHASNCLSSNYNANFCKIECQFGVYRQDISPCCQERCLMTNRKICLTSFPRRSPILAELDDELIHAEQIQGFFKCARTYKPACALVGSNATIKKHHNACQLCEDMMFNLHSQTSYLQVDISMCIDETFN